jgi:hypothetical protein
MTDDQLRAIRNTLRENHRYEGLPDKAVHKLSYLIYKKSKDRGVDIEIPFFWYRYGILTQTIDPNSSKEISPGLDNREERILNNVSKTILEKYYNTSLEEITDITYEDAPYDVFAHWRELDKQISDLKNNYNPFFDNTPIREEVEKKIESVYDSFPTSDFPHHQNDLSTWYFAMTRELDMGMENIQRLDKINTAFWGTFTLSVAKKHRHNMTEREVLQALGISSFESELQDRENLLLALESDGREDRFDSKSGDLTATTDAVMEPILKSL